VAERGRKPETEIAGGQTDSLPEDEKGKVMISTTGLFAGHGWRGGSAGVVADLF
jgi:hypothetical protein